MKALESVKDIMEKTGVKQVTLRKRLGLSSGSMTMRLKMENISVDKLNEMLRMLDYKLVIMPNTVQNKDGWYEVD